ncbi:hypothetical protein EKH55_5362 [Sinorhizobium alkalisoli]|nr:hypothetical protein EKH55_5362 [Sinorhizobium alkalisoli]
MVGAGGAVAGPCLAAVRLPERVEERRPDSTSPRPAMRIDHVHEP